MNQRARWMTRDFVFAAPVAFPHVIAVELERFELRRSSDGGKSLSLSVLALEANGALDLDRAFAGYAADVLGQVGPVDWLIEPRQLLGREARRGVGTSVIGGQAEALEVVLVRGSNDRPWVFARRSSVADEHLAADGLSALLREVQERAESTGEKLLQSQFARQERTRLLLTEAGARSERNLPDPLDPIWTARLAAALEIDDATAAPLIVDAVALVEEPYGEPLPIGVSRIGGGPDLQPGAWPTDARGMHHAFLMQVDLAEVAAACGSTMAELPEAGLLSFFVHDDALLVDVVYSPPGARLTRFPMTAEVIEASYDAIRLVAALPEEAQPGPLPHSEGDRIAAVLEENGTLTFSHSPDPVWAYGTAGERFDALSDERWACVPSARLRPTRTRSIDLAAAQARINDTGLDSEGDLEDVHDDLQWAPGGSRTDIDLPQIHQMLGHVTHNGWTDCREEAAEFAETQGHLDLTSPDDWMVLMHLPSGSATGREFLDALRLTVMAPVADVIVRRWDRCMLLAG